MSKRDAAKKAAEIPALVKVTMQKTKDGQAMKEVVPPAVAWGIGAAPFPPTPMERHIPVDVDVKVHENAHADRGREAARKVYETFHGKAPNKNLTVDIDELPESLPLLGTVTEIKYRVPSDAASDKGDYVYVHSFGDTGHGDTGAKPYALATGRDGEILIKSKPGEKPFTIERAGIVG